MASRPLWTLSLLLALLVLSHGVFNLADALDDSKSTTPAPHPPLPAGGTVLDSHDSSKVSTTTTGAPTKVSKGIRDIVNPKPKPDPDFDLADALDSKNDIGGKEKNKGQGGGFSDSDLVDISKDDTYKPDKGKGGARGGASDQINQYDDNTETTAEVGTIAGIASAVAMALVGAVTSYISYQKKKLCFSLQQSLNTDMVKAENPEAVVATEPQVQQTLLEPPNTEPPAEENAV